MSSSAWMLLGIAFGAVAAGVIVAFLMVAFRAGRTASRVRSTAPADGVIQVLRALPAPAFVVNASRVSLYANSEMSQLGLLDSHGEILVPEIIEMVNSARSTLQGQGSHIVVEHRRGADTPLDVNAIPLDDKHVLVVLHDRTHDELAESVRRDFTANMSHELKTPISAALLLSEALDKAADDPARVHRFATTLNTEMQHLQNMVTDIIQLSRIEERTDRTGFEIVDLSDQLDQWLETLRVAAAQRRITVSVSAEEGARVWGDIRTIETAIVNLVDNAVKYSPDGSAVGVAVAVKGTTVVITVSDQGPGISPAEQSRIFERFYRGDLAHSTTDGTGLGLSIARHAVQAMGGSLGVWSKVGVGSTFRAELPVANVGAPAEVEPEVPDARSDKGEVDV